MKKNILLILCFAILLTSVASCANNTSLITDSASNPALIEDTTNTPKETTNVLGSDSNAETTNEASLNSNNETQSVDTTNYLPAISETEPISKWNDVLDFDNLLDSINELDKYNTPLESLKIYNYGSLRTASTPRYSNLAQERPDYRMYLYASSKSVLLKQFHREFPIQHICKIDDNNVCVIYRTEGYGRMFYFYKVYTYEDVNESGIGKEWVDKGEVYFINKLYSIDDLNYLKPGSIMTFELLEDLNLWKVIMESGSVKTYMSFSDGIIEKEETDAMYPLNMINCTFRSLILLKEGVAVIYSTGESVISERIFISMEFYPYGTKCEKYPLMTILSDGFVPPLPE